MKKQLNNFFNFLVNFVFPLPQFKPHTVNTKIYCLTTLTHYSYLTSFLFLSYINTKIPFLLTFLYLFTSCFITMTQGVSLATPQY